MEVEHNFSNFYWYYKPIEQQLFPMLIADLGKAFFS